jgi:hypothetical protein
MDSKQVLNWIKDLHKLIEVIGFYDQHTTGPTRVCQVFLQEISGETIAV